MIFWYIFFAALVGLILVGIFIADKKRRDRMVERKDVSNPSTDPPVGEQKED